MNNNKINKGALLVILAGACWGSISIYIKYLDSAGLGTMQISFLKQMLSSVIFSLIIFIRDRTRFRIELKDLWLIMLAGLINGVVFNSLYFYTIVHSRASIAVVLLYTSPVFVIILARIFFGEKITGPKLLALILTVIGCVLVTGVLGDGYMPPAAAMVTGVLTGLAYALYNIFTSKAVRKNDPQTVTLYTLLFSFIFMIPFSGFGMLVPLVKANPAILAVTFMLSLVTSVAAQYFFAAGLKLIESGKAAIYGASEPIVGALVGILIFHEETNFLKIAGIVMVVTAIVIIGRNDSGTSDN